MSRSSVPPRTPRIAGRAALAVAVLALALAGCGGSPSGPASPAPGSSDEGTVPIPLVIDTDMSSDDIMAIAYLTTRTDYEIRAITVAGTGVVHCGPGERNLLNLLHELAHPPVPVACGSSEIPAGVRPIPDLWRLEADQAYGLALAESPETPVVDAAALIARAVTGSSRPVAVLTLGPMTNLAAALQLDEAVAAGIERIVIMGGAVGVPGNASIDGTEARAEWNIASDPLAAATVIGSGIPTMLVPLDATNHVPVTQAFVDKLRTDVGSGPANLLDEILTRNAYLVDGSSFWDALAAVGLVDLGVVTLEDARIGVTVEGPDLGWTRSTADGALVALAVAADPAAFEDAFLAALRTGPPRLTPFDAGGGTP